MKLTGIIKEHSTDFKIKSDAEPFDIFKRLEYEKDEKEKILNYLRGGVSVSVTMMLLYSLIVTEKNKVIGGLVFLTDGEWIWPNYLGYYVSNCNLKLDDEFLNHIRAYDYQPKNVSKQEEVMAIEYLKEITG